MAKNKDNLPDVMTEAEADDRAQRRALELRSKQRIKNITYNYTKPTGDAICQAVVNGMSVKEICNGGVEGAPPAQVMYKWLEKYPKFAADYKLARKAVADYHANMIEDRIKDSRHWTKDDALPAKVEIDARKWLAAKNNPQQYGDVGVTKGDVGAVTIIVNTGVPPKEPRFVEARVERPAIEQDEEDDDVEEA